MSESERETLERFFDGELPPEEAAAVARRLEADEALAAELTELTTLRTLLRDHVQQEVAAADFSGFFDGIAAAIAEAPAPAEVSPRPARPEAASEPSAWERLRAWWGRNWTPVVVSAAAAAAVALIVVRAGGPGSEGIEEGVETDAPVVVEAVSNGGDQTVLISSPAEDSGGATVIWLLDEEEAAAEDEDASVTGEDPI